MTCCRAKWSRLIKKARRKKNCKCNHNNAKVLFSEEMNLFFFPSYILHLKVNSRMLSHRITWITSQGFWSNNGTFVIVARDVIAKLPPDFVGVTCIWNLEAGPNNPLGRWGPMISMRFVVIVTRIVVIKGTRVQSI